MKYLKILLVVIFLIVSTGIAYAGAPFINLQGVGGCGFNPFAYVADSDGDNSHYKIGDVGVLGKPRFGAWYVNLDHVNVDWTAVVVADTL